MQEGLQKISDYWEEIYSRRVKDYQPFKISSDFERLASMFAVGNSYFYIVNLHDFSVEYMSDSVQNFFSKDAKEIDLKDLLSAVVPEEIKILELRSKVVSNFYTSFLDKESVMKYKNMFTYRMRDGKGQTRTMLYQAFPLSVLENGAPEHVFCLHSDVSHLKVSSDSSVSFVHMNGGKCYFNVSISTGKFDPGACGLDSSAFSAILTEREKQIIYRLAKGLSAEQIATELNLSHHTIKTHRRNILQKSGCTNTTELVAKCLTHGIISPELT